MTRYRIEPGHETWVVGDEPLVAYEFESSGAATYGAAPGLIRKSPLLRSATGDVARPVRSSRPSPVRMLLHPLWSSSSVRAELWCLMPGAGAGTRG